LPRREFEPHKVVEGKVRRYGCVDLLEAAHQPEHAVVRSAILTKSNSSIDGQLGVKTVSTLTLLLRLEFGSLSFIARGLRVLTLLLFPKFGTLRGVASGHRLPSLGLGYPPEPPDNKQDGEEPEDDDASGGSIVLDSPLRPLLGPGDTDEFSLCVRQERVVGVCP
jgi:hypothetical protein